MRHRSYFLILSLIAVGAAYAEQPYETAVAIAAIHSEDLDEEQKLIVDIVDDQLPQALEKAAISVRSDFGRPRIQRLGPLPHDDDIKTTTALELRKDGVDWLLTPQLTISPRGYLVRVGVVDLDGADEAPWQWSDDQSVVSGMNSDVGFDEIESEIQSLADRVAALMWGSPGHRIFVWCISPGFADDELSRIARQLTLELPYLLSERIRSEPVDLEVAGVNPRNFHPECQNQDLGYRLTTERYEARIDSFDYVVSGVANRVAEGAVVVGFLLYDSGAHINRPLGKIALGPSLTTESLSKFADLLSHRILRSVVE